MIPVVPTSRILLVLATFFVVLASLNLISNWILVPQVGASPVTFTDARREISPRRFCADLLADEIHLVCAGQTLSLSDAYPNSFGNRSKRQGTSDGSLTRDCCINKCSYAQLRQYCAPSIANP